MIQIAETTQAREIFCNNSEKMDCFFICKNNVKAYID